MNYDDPLGHFPTTTSPKTPSPLFADVLKAHLPEKLGLQRYMVDPPPARTSNFVNY